MMRNRCAHRWHGWALRRVPTLFRWWATRTAALTVMTNTWLPAVNESRLYMLDSLYRDRNSKCEGAWRASRRKDPTEVLVRVDRDGRRIHVTTAALNHRPGEVGRRCIQSRPVVGTDYWPTTTSQRHLLERRWLLINEAYEDDRNKIEEYELSKRVRQKAFRAERHCNNK